MSDSLPSLRRRIQTADDLRSVVRTMKAMAAASIAQFERATESLSDYHRCVELCLALYFRRHPPSARGDVLSPRSGEKRRAAFLVFGTDQGMVGQFNEALAAEAAERLAAATEPDSSPPLVWVAGERMRYRIESAGHRVSRVFPTPSSIESVTPLITEALREIERAWDDGRIASVDCGHNAPLSRANYQGRWTRLLPLDRDWEQRLRDLPWPTRRLPELAGESEETLPAFLSEFLFVTLFKACAESLAAENGARLAAMQRAEKNIDDRLREFRLDFNRLRQKAIDEELFDLLAGFESLTDETGRP